jgi:hypothetical protein
MKNYITRTITSIIWLATIAAIALGYNLLNIAGCVLGAIGLVRAYDLKTLKGKKASKAFLLFTIWTLYMLYVTAQVVISAWLWITYPIIMTIIVLLILGLYIYMRPKIKDLEKKA